MDQQNPTLAEIPILDTGKFEQWQFRMQQYLQHELYALWEVIEFGDSYEAPANAATTCTASDGTGKKKGRTITLTADDMQKRKNDVKVRTTLLLSLLDEHQVIVSQLQFMDVEIEQDDFNQNFFTSLAPEWFMHTIIWRNRSDLDTMILDDLYNHLKVYESEVQKKSERNSQNMPFISSAKHNRGNEEVNTASTNVSTASANIEVVSISQDTACAYIASQSSASQIKFEDINQIDEDDMKEMDIKWNMDLLSMRADRFWKKTGKKISIQGINVAGFDKSKVEYFNCHKMGHSARECRAPKSQDRRRRDNYRQGSKVEEQALKVLMAIDRVGWEWIYMGNDEENHALIADEETPTEFALMAKTSAESEELELIKKEKEGLDSKLSGFQTALKDLDSLLESQRLDNNKEGLGYSVVPPPSAQVYSPPKKDLSWTGLPKFKDDTANDSPTKSKTDKVETAKKPPVKYVEQYRKPTKKPNVRGNQRNWNNFKSYQLGPNFVMEKKACFNCGNISYLSDYEPFDGGYVSFGQKGCKITGKGTIKTECIVLGRDFKLLDNANVLLRTPRQHNMYSINLNNIVPHKDLTCLVAKASANKGMLWHRRLCHLNFKTMNRLVRHNLVRGLPSKCFENDHTCTACLKGKQHKPSCKSKLVNSVTKPRHTLHMDLFSPTSDETSGILRKFITDIENLKDLKVKIIRCDNGGEFRNKEMDDICLQKGIVREFSNARTPRQNGVAERRNRTLIEATKTMLADAKLPVIFWAEAVKTAFYVQNRVLVNKSHNKASYELFNGRSPAIGFLKPFGCHVMILNTLDHLGKFKAKGDEGYFIRYSMFSKAFMVFNKRTKKVEERLHVEFLENKAIEKGVGLNWLYDIDSLTKSMNYVPVVVDQSWVEAMQEELLQFKIHNVWTLVDCPKGVRPIGTKWVLKNKKDKRRIVIRNKARLVAQRYIQDEGINYDEMDVKSAFLYGTIDEEVYVMQPSRFQDPEFPARVYKVEKAIEFEALMHEKFQMSAMGELNFFLCLQVLQKEDGIFLSQDKYVGDILKTFGYSDVRSDTPMEKENPWGKDEIGKDVDFHHYRSMIGSLMHLTASRPDIMFAVYACARHHVTPKECHLHAVKRIFRYLKGHPKLGLCVDHIHTDENVADILTKPFDAERFQYLVDLVANMCINFLYGSDSEQRTHEFIHVYLASASVYVWIGYALTFKPTVYVSHIRQFWSTAKIETTKEGTKILATVDGILRTITESSLSRNLKLNDEEGISSLPNAKLFENLTLMGYNISPNQKFTFQKGQFSHQWKYLIHTIMQCLSPKSIGFNKFSSNIATALVCLATNRVYNFSKMIFDIMVKNVNNKVSKFLMYPRVKVQEHQLSPIIHPPLRQNKHHLLLIPRQHFHLLPLPLIPTVTPSDTSPLRQYTRRARIAQSSALLPVADEPASPLQDAIQSESDLVSKFDAQKVEITMLKARVKLLKDREGGGAEQFRDNAQSRGGATVLSSGVAEVPTGSDSIPTAGSPAAEVPTGSDVVPTVGPIFATSTVVTPYIRRKGKEKMIESENPKKKNIQEWMDIQVARQLEEEMERESQRMNKQTSRDAKIARIHAEEELQIMIDGLDRSNETVAKYLQEYHQFATELPLERRIELISDLVRKGIRFEQESVKKLKTSREVKASEEVPEEKVKEMMQVVLVKEVYVESFQVKHPIIDWKVELKRLYEKDVEDQLWTHTQNMMHAPVEWKLYDSCGVHHVTSKDNEIFMLIEKDYPLRKGLAIVMICYKLQVENYSQMASDLILKIQKIANRLRQKDD
uniref:Integrase catalytic domain-containing protein n=1 Tax=Tanacetum cinerariifolium TaxID=118510 RepID=A0A6L2MHJ6_TANCI|nr:hypothetical protein [Tanacetum cinerariifolium]